MVRVTVVRKKVVRVGDDDEGCEGELEKGKVARVKERRVKRVQLAIVKVVRILDGGECEGDGYLRQKMFTQGPKLLSSWCKYSRIIFTTS